MLPAGGLKAGAKRTAFGDVSNTAKNLANSRDDSAVNGKPVEIVKSVAAKDKQAAFLRPAQRPITNNTIKIVQGTVTTVDSSSTAPNARADAKQMFPALKRVQSKKSTAIYKDIDAQDTVIAQVAHALSARPESAVLPPVHQTLAPRQYQSQPFLRDQVPSQVDRKLRDITESAAPTSRPQTSYEDAREQQHGSEQRIGASQVIEGKVALDLPTGEAEVKALVKSVALVPEQSCQHAEDNPGCGTQRQLPALPEPEEYWEEDEEDEVYDEQGYTTAHSYRSRGDNTTGGATTVLLPRVTNKVKKELQAAKDLVDRTRSQEDVDDEAWDTSMVAEYGEEIFAYMRELEVSLQNYQLPKQQHRAADGRGIGPWSRQPAWPQLSHIPAMFTSQDQLLTSL